ncbi:MAG: alpha-galactosidase [Acidobacteria bacterium]|nr:alpha-galactosidase [Acidobacteriota bacterium]
MHMGRALLFLCLLSSLAATAQNPPGVSYDPDARSWSLSNGLVEARYVLDENGLFRLQTLRRPNGKAWVAEGVPASSPIHLEIDGTALDMTTPWELLDTWTESAERGGQLHVIVLRNAEALAEIQLRIEIHPGQPFIRTYYAYRNLDEAVHYVNQARFLNLRLNSDGQAMRGLYVNQYRQNSPLLYDPIEAWLAPDQPVRLFTGAYADHCTWLALSDEFGNGVVLGWESDARARVSALLDGAGDTIVLEGGPSPLHAPVAPGEQLAVPASFTGLFEGDWDEGSYRTHRYVEGVLAAPPPDANFPYFMFDSWGYRQDIDEATMRRAAEIAAQVGVEVFIVDLGWARHIGDWVEDRAKFPSGLRALSDYVHSLGMKFGLHFVPVEAADESPVLQENPDWTSTWDSGYFNAHSICISNQPAQQWLQQAALSVVQVYNPDWFVQDAENLVKECTKDTHTHDPANSNWDNAVNGLDLFMKFMRAAAPQIGWENNADGGTMATFDAVKRYATFGGCDACGHMDRRRVTHGMTYVFPPRFISRYMEEPPIKFTTRSSMFGGPWILMQRITEWTPAEIDLVRQEAALYKSLRGLINRGKVYHLLERPSDYTTAAIESFDAESDRGLVFVYRPDSSVSTQTIYPRGLNPNRNYRVTFQETSDSSTQSGAEWMRRGIAVKLPSKNFAEIVYITGL